MTRIQIVPGLAVPFFPMRPSTRLEVKTAAALAGIMERALSLGALVQPKLNGDRVELGKTNGQVYFSNRHGSDYKFVIRNSTAWNGVPDGTVLDGEVWAGKFYPFEALAVGGVSLTAQNPHRRAAEAAALCALFGQDYLFQELSPAAAESLRAKWVGNKKPDWEGVVVKTGPYVCLGSAGADSPNWAKHKWV